MTSNANNEHIDLLVKARWLAIGLSQADLFEVLDASCKQTPREGNGSNRMDAGRLMQIAGALDIPCDLSRNQGVATARQAADLAPPADSSSLSLLLELRLVRAFHRMGDDRTKLMLVHLAEQIVRRQTNRDADPSGAG
jgi:hypothetical protein